MEYLEPMPLPTQLPTKELEMSALEQAVAVARMPDASAEDKAWADWLLWLARDQGEISAQQVLDRMGL